MRSLRLVARGSASWALALLLCACEAPQRPLNGVTTIEPPTDEDADGLCDVTEEQAATRPDALDTDADGIPDLPEVVFGYDAVNPDDPLETELVYLSGSPGASAPFEVRSTVVGAGEAHGGAFEGLASLDASGVTAADFFVQAMAVSADPPENVRRIEADGERFASVLGETRLSFKLEFRYGRAEPAPCTQAFPFRYLVKSEAGRTLDIQAFLLIVGPAESAADPESYCLPSSCF
jgi:hypothetical protein